MKHRGFTLIELLCVVAILGLLVSLTLPALGKARDRAESAACFGNLRQIGVAVSLYVSEHDNTFPCIETDPSLGKLYPEEMQAKPMLETLSRYGVSEKTLQCPSDIGDPNANYFAKKGTSYEWRPILDGENAINPTFLTRRGAVRVPPSRFRQVMDFAPVHSGRQNALYADGHVRWH